MAVITSYSRVKTFPQMPLKISVTADQWRVIQIDPDGDDFAPWCETEDEFGIMFFSTPGQDGPTDGASSSGGGDFDLADVRKYAGSASASSRSQPSIRLGNKSGKASPTYVAISSTASITVYAELY